MDHCSPIQPPLNTRGSPIIEYANHSPVTGVSVGLQCRIQIDCLLGCDDIPSGDHEGQESLHVVLKEIRDANRSLVQLREDADFLREENELYLDRGRALKAEICARDDEIKDLRIQIEALQANSETRIKQGLNVLMSAISRCLARFVTSNSIKREKTISFLVISRWRMFVKTRIQGRSEQFSRILYEVLNRSIRRIFCGLWMGTQQYKPLAVQSCINCMLTVAPRMEWACQTAVFLPTLTLRAFEDLTVSNLRDDKECGIVTDKEILSLLSTSAIECSFPCYLVMQLMAGLAIDPPPEPAVKTRISVDREKRQRILIRLLNRRLGKLEKRLSRYKRMKRSLYR